MQRLNAQRGWALTRNRLFRFGPTPFLAGLAVLSIASATLIFAAPGSQAAGNVTVGSSQAYTGDTMEISLEGFPGDYPVPAGSVTLAGVRLSIPGVFGAPGVTPKTDNLGNVTFGVQIPLSVPFGTQTLSVNHFAGDGVRTATVTVLAAEVSFAPASASPNQAVVIHGSGFNSASSPGGKGPLGVHQITGEGSSGIMVNGLMLGAPYLTYPVNLDSDGGLTASLTLPEGHVNFPGGTLEVKVIDDVGRSGAGVWIIRPRKITLSPAQSGRGGTVTVTGTGFMATDESIAQCVTVDVSYAGTLLKKVRPDSTGSFVTTITVPVSTAISSTNTVTAAIFGCPAAPAATATHKVPARAMTIAPLLGQIGTQITVSGVSFVGYTTITALTIGTISVLPSPLPIVAEDGSFSFKITVPTLTLGTQVVNLTSGGAEYVKLFEVLVILPTPTPSPTPAPTATPTPTPTPTPSPTPFPSPTPTITPTPTPAPTPTPVPKVVDSLRPLEGNLLRIWTYNDALGQWDFYDPRPGFAGINNLTGLIGGNLYWINVKENLTVTLNGRQRGLIAGWNLIHW